MRTANDLMVVSPGDLEVEPFGRDGPGGVPQTDDTWPEESWQLPARPVVFFFACLFGWAAVVGTVIFLLLF